MSAASGSDDTRLLNLFVDLLERCLALNPDRRITPAEALKHSFFQYHINSGKDQKSRGRKRSRSNGNSDRVDGVKRR